MVRPPSKSQSNNPAATGRTSTRVLLVGWDGADNQTVRRLLDSGTLPHLSSLLRRGAMLELAVPPPVGVESAWTTLATGTRPHQHGILQPLVPAQSGLGLEPVSPRNRLRPAVWNILTAAGLNSHVVGWPVTFPAEAIRGVCVSDPTPPAEGDAQTGKLLQTIVSPEELRPVVASRCIDPAQIDEITLSQLLPQSARSLPEQPRLTAACRAILADAATRFRIFRWCLQERPWDFAACIFPGLRRMHELALRLGRTSTGAANAAQDLIAGGYEHHDMLLGQLIQQAGCECSVIAISLGTVAHGGGALAGMAAISDPAIRASHTPVKRSVLDVAPTILSLLNLPSDVEMPGRPLYDLFEAPLPSCPVADYEALKRATADDRFAAEPGEARIDESVAHLIQLGYVDPAETAAQQAVDHCVWTGDLNRAISQLDAGIVGQAIELLSRAVAERPSSHAARAILADALYRAGRRGEARQEIQWLRYHGNEQPQVYQLSAAIELAERKFDEALAELEGTRRGSSRSFGADVLEGNVWLRKRKFAASSKAFQAAIEREGPAPASLSGLAAVKLQTREFESAAEHALDALSMDISFGRARYCLAMALFHLGKPQEALRALEAWAAMNPDRAAPYRWMASICDLQLQDPQRAESFRTQARELVRNHRRTKVRQLADTSALSYQR